VIALVAGLSIALLTPPLRGADEADHFARAFQISNGDFLTHKMGRYYGAFFPAAYPHQMTAITRSLFNIHDKTAFLRFLTKAPPRGRSVFLSEGTIASYGPGAYVVYAPVIAIGRALGLSLMALLYLARLAGVVVYAFLLSLAVRRLPLHKWVLVICGLIPEALNQASTVSADGLTNVLTLLLVAEALRFCLDPPQRSRRLLIEASLAATCLALAKPPYFLFVLLFLIPAWRQRDRLLWPLLGVISWTLLLAVPWIQYQRGHSMALDIPGFWLPGTVTRHLYGYRQLNIPAQTHFVLSQPLHFFNTVWHSFYFQGFIFPRQMLGLMSTYQLPTAIVIVSLGTIALSCLIPDQRPVLRLPMIERVLLLTLSTSIALIICAIVYTSANALHAPRIDELTPRYFLPLIPPTLIAVLPVKFLTGRTLRLVLPLLATTALIVLWVSALVGLQHFQFQVNYGF
jgi:uncharacterized membrane protein